MNKEVGPVSGTSCVTNIRKKMNNVKHDIPIAVKKTTMTGQELRQLVLRLFRVKVKVQYSQIHAMKEHKGK